MEFVDSGAAPKGLPKWNRATHPIFCLMIKVIHSTKRSSYLYLLMAVRKLHIPFLLFAFINLFVGILAGLIRIGWDIPVSGITVHHGAIMVGCFLGSLILLEKAIPLKKNVLLVFPFVNALGLLMIVPGFYRFGQGCLVIGALGLLFIFLLYYKKQPDQPGALMIVGALCLLTGNLLLIAKQFYPMIFPWWMGFILFTIVGERIELSKFLPVTRVQKIVLTFFLCMYLAGVLTAFHGMGRFFSGLALVLVATWLMRFDVIAIGLRKSGLTKFSAMSLLTGCVALLGTGIFLIVLPDMPYAYDVTVHMFFLGFAFSMIFAHGPIILPGVLGLSVKPYHPLLYVPLFTLSISLWLRVLADLSVVPNSLRLWSGWISAGSILLYFMVLASTVLTSASLPMKGISYKMQNNQCKM